MENFTLIIGYISPIVLAGLLVYWVYSIQSALVKLRNEVVQSNQAVAQAFNALAARLPNPPEAQANEVPPQTA